MLRKVDSSDASIVYAGELTTPQRSWASRFSVLPTDGRISVEATGENGDPAPAWLVDFAVATLRTAWRAHREGGRWPRRLSRWRRGPDSEIRR